MEPTKTDRKADRASLTLHQSHPRDWGQNRYVYPVLSRRSHGLSIGINLNPDKACNFDCIYCQVDRTVAPQVRKVDLGVLEGELDDMVSWVADGAVWKSPPFDAAPPSQRRLNDLAFSGDGEPTTFKPFDRAVQIAIDALAKHTLDDVKIILITDACYLTKSHVRRGLALMDAHRGEVWAKLDAGTEAYFRRVNKPNFSLRHVLDNIIDAARVRPVVIQSLWMQIDGDGPPDSEIAAFVERLHEIRTAGGRISGVQVYTVARRPADSSVTPLSNADVDAIADRVRQGTGLTVEAYYEG
ncbi:MAG: radical SAM protein [Planctomycetes bacterium]|nr:radical SAM protein [Planctomycetota bacterium]